MTSLLSLVAPLIGNEALDPAVVALLEGVDTAVTALTAEAQPLGTTAAEPVWMSLRRLLLAPSIDIPPFPDGLLVDGRTVGETGWELGIDLPSFEIAMPVVQPATLQPQGGRSVAVAAAGQASLHVDAAHIAVRALNGTDPVMEIADLVIAITPDVVLLPGGFALRIGPVTFGVDGVDMPAMELLLPPLPQLPTGPLPVPAMLRRSGGVFVNTPAIELPPLPGLRGCSIAITIDRPDAMSFSDLVPTLVEIIVPLAATSFTTPGIGAVAPAATLQGPQLVIELSTTNDRVRLRGALTGDGDEHGIVVLAGGTPEVTALLAVVAALGPYLADEDAGGAELALLGAAAAGMVAAVDAAGASVILHAISISAEWDTTPPGPADLRILIDYECRLPMSFGAGALQVGTRPEGPYRVRHRDVRVQVVPVPALSWRGATSSVVSAGDWVVPEVLADLLRIAAVRTRKGSLDIELDLSLALDLGVVKVDGATVRVSIENGSATVTPAGFTVSIDVPGTVTGRGQLSFRDGGFEAALDVRLPTLGAGGRAAVGVDGDMVMIAIRADLFTPIPLANSGLGLFSLGGMLAANARPNLRPGDPISAALAWSPWDAGSWLPGNQMWMGFLAGIGTVPDFGFALSGDAVILVGVPEPSVRASLSAEVLSGIGGTMLGVLSIDSDQLVVAVRGDYAVPHLVTATLPAGAIFPFAHLDQWSVRLGGDRTLERGEPVTASILPDLLRLEAWMFLMAFGSANAIVGDALAPGHGLPLHGMSLAFGAGFNVEWSCGPFSFEAGGVILAALTHRPSGGEGPWVLSGYAELHGSVDLGPVSIGASADLTAFVDPDAGVFYANAHACASVDLWFTEIRGCVHVEIGDKPLSPAPKPPSPVLRVALTDRVGNVVGEAPSNPSAPAVFVWPDVIPVVVFETWVGSPNAIPGLGTLIGNNVPAGDGWLGTAELAYRFDLTSVRVVEVDGEVEISGAWPASWQLPLTHDVFGGGAPPAQARSLALNVLDLHHWLQPALMVPDDAPGNPMSVLGRLCDPVPTPAAVWFPGGGAQLPPHSALRLSAVGAVPGEPVTINVFLHDETEYPADENAAAHASIVGHAYRPPGVQSLDESIDAAGHTVSAMCWLPLAYHSDMRSDIVLRVDQPLHEAVLIAVMPEEHMFHVESPGGASWGVSREAIGQWIVETWRCTGGPVTDIVVRSTNDQQIGLLGVAGITDVATRNWAAVEASRAATHAALEDMASNADTRRRLMRRDRRHRVDVSVHWQSRGSMYKPSLGDTTTTSFFFTTAPPSPPRPPSQPAAGGALQPFSLFSTQVFQAMFAQSVLADADLGRYISGFLPRSGTALWFTRDPVQVQFLVDHLTELAAAYDSALSVTARRTDAAPGAPPTAVVPEPIPVPQPFSPGVMLPDPVVLAGLTALDGKRLAHAIATDAQPGGCKVPRPGAAAKVPVVLEPEAAYRLTLTVDRNGAVVGSGAVIGEAHFTTSRYADPANLLDDLGFTPAGATAVTCFPLPTSAALPAATDPFDSALEALCLGGYGAAAIGSTASLWMPAVNGGWQFVGVLVECPEPIQRLGRLAIEGVTFDGQPSARVVWDGTRSRFLALTALGAAAPNLVTLRVTDSPHGAAATRSDVSAAIVAYVPQGDA